MKLRYFLKEKLNLSNSYVVALLAVLLVAVIGGSYAIFTTTSEGKGALNIVTGDLKPHMESLQLDENKSIELGPNEVKTVMITLKNINKISAKYNLYYSVNKEDANIEIGYLKTGDEAPTTAGYVIGKNGNDNDTKKIKVRILNNEKENVTLSFGSDVGLANADLSFPVGKQALSEIKSNIIQAFTYDEKNEQTKCINGEEETCVKATCLDEESVETCPVGTIIRYAVNDTKNYYFYVLHDDGEKITMQQRENTVKNIAWYEDETETDNTTGPNTVLPKLEETTSTWTNVNELEYTPSKTVLYENEFTGCESTVDYKTECKTNTYTDSILGQRKARARMITAQEASATGCLVYKDGSSDPSVIEPSFDAYNRGSCLDFMQNYMYHSEEYGGSYSDDTIDGDNQYDVDYWLMSASSTNPSYAWIVSSQGYLHYDTVSSKKHGARAVVEITKP